MSFKKIFSGAVTVSQISVLFFTCPTTQVKAGQLLEKSLNKLLEAVTLTFSQVQEMKKLLDKGLLDSEYIISNDEENKKGSGNILTFGNLLQKIEQFLCINLDVLKTLKFEFNYEEYEKMCKEKKIENNEKERLEFCLKKIKEATKDNFLKGKEYDEAKNMSLVSKKVVYDWITCLFNAVKNALKENSINIETVMKNIKESRSLEYILFSVNSSIYDEQHNVDFTFAYNNAKIPYFYNVLKFLKIYSQNKKNNKISLEFFPNFDQEIYNFYPKISKKEILEAKNYPKVKEEERKRKEEEERKRKEEKNPKESKILFEKSLKKLLKVVTLSFSQVQEMKKLLDEGLLDKEYIVSNDQENKKGNILTFGHLLQKIEQFLCINLDVLKTLKFEFNYEEYEKMCKEKNIENNEKERLEFCFEKIKEATKDNFLRGKEYNGAKFLSYAIAAKSRIYKQITFLFNSVKNAVKENSMNIETVMKNIKASFSERLKDTLEILSLCVYNENYDIDFTFAYNNAKIPYFYNVLKFLKIYSQNEKNNKISLGFFPDFNKEIYNFYPKISEKEILEAKNYPKVKEEGRKRKEEEERKRKEEEERKRKEEEEERKEAEYLERLLGDVATSFSQIQKMKKRLGEGFLDNNYVITGKKEDGKGHNLTFGQILQEFEKILCVYLDVFRTLKFEINCEECKNLCQKTNIKDFNKEIKDLCSKKKEKFNKEAEYLCSEKIKNAKKYRFLEGENLKKAKFLTDMFNTVLPRNRFNKKIEKLFQSVEDAIDTEEDKKNVVEIMESVKDSFSESLEQIKDLVKLYQPGANNDNTPDFTFVYDNAKIFYYQDVLKFLKIYSKNIGNKEGLDSESFPNLNEEMSEENKLEVEKFYREKEKKEKNDDLKRRRKNIIRQELIANLHNANKDKSILDLQLNLFRCCKKILYINYFIDRIFFLEESKRYSEVRSIKSQFNSLNRICFKVLLHYFCCYENDKIEEVTIKKLAVKNEKEFFEVVKDLSETIDKFFQTCFLTLDNASDKTSSVITSRIIFNYLLRNVKSIQKLYELEDKFKNYETTCFPPLTKLFLNYLKKLGKVELFLDKELPDPNCNKDLLREELLKKLSNILPKELFGEKCNIEDKNFITVKSAFYNFYNNTFSTQYLSMLFFIRDFLDNLKRSNKSKDAPIHIEGTENIKKFFDITNFFQSYAKKYMENIEFVDGGCNIKRIDFDNILVTTIKTAINSSIDSSVLTDNFKKFQKETGIDNISKIDEDGYKKEYLDKAYDIKRENLENHTVEDFNMRDNINKYLCLKEEEQKKFVLPVMDEMFSKVLENMEIEFYSENNFADSFNK